MADTAGWLDRCSASYLIGSLVYLPEVPVSKGDPCMHTNELNIPASAAGLDLLVQRAFF